MYFSALKFTKLANFSVKNSILSLVIQKRIKNIYKFISNPFDCQSEILKYLVKKGKKTSFGKEHNFNEISDYNSFKKNIPIRKYEELANYINKIRNGGTDVLWPGKIKRFAKSSGTTNSKSKYIPVTDECLQECHFKAGKDMLSLYENNFPKSDLYNGKGLMLGGSLDKFSKEKIQEGDLSAILLNEFPFWVSYHRVPDLETALMKEWDEKLNKIAHQAISENITSLTGVPSWMLILLKRVLALSGAKNISELWPNLELYMHGGVNFEPYKKQFEELIPSKKMNYLENYNASEGFIAVQDQSVSKGMLLMLDYGIFYEFLDIEKYRKSDMSAIDLKHVELGKKYALIMSTNAGLWRYMIGDIIEFTSISPFRIKIVGRTKSCINTFGEELMVHNTDQAVSEACKKHNCSINDYTVAPVFIANNSGGHQWLIEFEKKPSDIKLFMKEIDDTLKKLNSDYEAKRTDNLILKFPEVIVLQNKEFYTWLKQNKRLGGQNKIPRLNESRIIAEEIITIKNKFSTNQNTNNN